MKTAMQELIEYMENESWLSHEMIQDKATNLLEKEKEQIKAAWQNRDEFYEHYDSESYYQKTYNS